MKAVVLAGGYATRLWPITKHRPKMLLPIGDSTVIERIFADLEADERVSEVFVSTNERFADDFEEFLSETPFEKPTLSVEQTSDEGEKLGVVGALAQLIDRENVTEDLLVVAGDNLLSFNLTDFIDFFEQKGTPAIAAYDVGSRDRARSYGVVGLEGTRVVDFQEKPADPDSTLVSIACYAFPRETLVLFEEYLSAGENPDEPGWFVQWLQNRQAVHAFTFDGAWFDIGTPESYLDAVAWYLDGDNYVAEGTTVENATLEQNVHVMDGATVEDATLDRSVVFPGATVRNAEVRGSILDRESRVENLDLAGALVGAHSRLTDGE